MERIVQASSKRVDRVRRATALLSVGRCGEFVSDDQALVPDGDGPAEAQERSGHGGRSGYGAKKGMMDVAYRTAEAAGIALCTQVEAGPDQTIPYLCESWELEGTPARQPHEYVRNGTAKLLTLFRPATGEVRAKGVTTATNTVLHPWLKAELSAIMATLPEITMAEEERPEAARWLTWLGHEPRESLPPLRMILIWDNLAGHLSWSIVRWLFQHGVMPLYTPLPGSWLNLAESLQRIIVRCALSGKHPQSPDEIITCLDETVAAWKRTRHPLSGAASARSDVTEHGTAAWAAHSRWWLTPTQMRHDPVGG